MKTMLVVILMALLLGCVKDVFAAPVSNSIETDLINWANIVRKSLPMVMNDELQATNIAAVGKVLILKYNFLKKKVNIYNLEQLKTEYYSDAINAACTNPDTRQLINAGVTVQYEYYDRDNIFLMKFKIDKNICKGL